MAVIYLKAGIFEGGRISDVSNFALKLGYYFVDMKKTEIESTYLVYTIFKLVLFSEKKIAYVAKSIFGLHKSMYM